MERSVSKCGEFLISINDGYCEWTFAFYLGGDHSIQSIAEAIHESLGGKQDNGTLRRRDLKEFGKEGSPSPVSLGATINGMALRDYFAGQALAGRLAYGHNPIPSATDAYTIADAMLAAREASK